MLGYSADGSSYTSACQEDPELKSFDLSVYVRTSKLITSLYTRKGQNGNLSLDSVTEACGVLLDLSQGVVKIITDSKEDVLKNEEVKLLVDLYFESTTNTLNLFNTVENCVKKAKISQMNIRIAIKQFEKESMDTDFGGNMKKKKKKYAKTLEELKKVKAMGDPFGDEFADKYESIYKEQLVLLKKLRALQAKFDKKQKNAKKTRILVNTVFATAMAAIIASSICVCAVTAPMGTVAIGFIPSALAASAQIAAAWIRLNDMFKDYENFLKNMKGFLHLTENCTKVNIEAMTTIKNLVDKLITSISLILEPVESAVQKQEEEAIELVVKEIINNVDEFSDKIKEVGEHVAKCSKMVAAGRVTVLENITKLVAAGKW